MNKSYPVYDEKEVEVRMILVVKKGIDVNMTIRESMFGVIDAQVGIRDFKIEEVKDL
jgi:hypothetical protein